MFTASSGRREDQWREDRIRSAEIEIDFQHFRESLEEDRGYANRGGGAITVTNQYHHLLKHGRRRVQLARRELQHADSHFGGTDNRQALAVAGAYASRDDDNVPRLPCLRRVCPVLGQRFRRRPPADETPRH